MRRIRALLSSVSFRLILGVSVTIAVCSALFLFLYLRTTTTEWLKVMENATARTSELVRRASHYGMLLNRKEDVHQTIREIGKGPGVAGIRVFDKNGRIIFSADEAEIGRKVDLKAEACTTCHDPEGPLRAGRANGRSRTFRTPEGHGVIGVITPIENQPECSNASCHAHPKSQTILGVLDVQLSTAFMEDTLRRTSHGLISAMILLGLLMAGGTALFIHRFVRRPVQRLQEGTRRIAAGDLDSRIEISSHDELGALARAFNRMTEDLGRARAELTDWSKTLERKVQEKTEALERTQSQLIHVEKMASVGKLAAIVAHELNNPLAGILTYAKLVSRELEAGAPPPEALVELRRYLSLIQSESSRCGGIVKNLLVFSRRSAAHFAPASLGLILDRALMLVHHQLELAGIRTERAAFEGDDELVCDSNQIEQAVVALLVNAIEAMAERPEPVLTIRLEAQPDALRVSLGDTGCGIPPEVQPHVFEPFFTTKTEGSGNGLGLSVVYGIVQRHGGTIDLESTPGEGTTFHLRLPRTPPAATSESAP